MRWLGEKKEKRGVENYYEEMERESIGQGMQERRERGRGVRWGYDRDRLASGGEKRGRKEIK